MKICEWLLGVEYDVIIKCRIFSFTWIVRKCMKLLSHIMKSMLINVYMTIDVDVCW